jgi:hypothetical protein
VWFLWVAGSCNRGSAPISVRKAIALALCNAASGYSCADLQSM